MTSRRRFIQTLAALPPAFAFRHSNAAVDPSRLALIIGNSSYRVSPLLNPANDAKAVSGLFTEAGFTVDSLFNANRADMMAAIERFGAAVKRSETKLVVFYYAGHGAQLDWRNYLLPVDAVVERQEDMKQRCIDLNLLLGQFSAAKDKTFVVILDACRNNPFGNSYRPDQKGLSQFDAPVGSLLAYATSPGNVASDGEGANGLYTEHLVRELSKRNTRIEDALKRVRLNVRLASRGAQIPWETTSLETNVFIFNEAQKKLSEAEEEKLLESDFAEWGRIKSSRKVDDWVGYLRTFPNGRFAEIAQARLTRLLAETATAKPLTASASPAPTQAAAPTPAPSAPSVAPMIDIRVGNAVPALFVPSTNPFSAGHYPLGRNFSVGDEALIRVSDLISGAQTEMRSLVVTRVIPDEDRVEFNDGAWISDLMGNWVRVFNGQGVFSSPQQLLPGELYVGKKWTTGYKQTNRVGPAFNVALDIRVVAFERLRVAAGEFDTFRIEGEGWQSRGGWQVNRLWVVPGLNFAVKAEVKVTGQGGTWRGDRLELVSLRQQTIDTKCATPTGGLQRTLVIQSNCT